MSINYKVNSEKSSKIGYKDEKQTWPVHECRKAKLLNLTSFVSTAVQLEKKRNMHKKALSCKTSILLSKLQYYYSSILLSILTKKNKLNSLEHELLSQSFSILTYM